MRLKKLFAIGSAAACLALLPGPATSQTSSTSVSAEAAPAPAMTEEDLQKFVIGNLLFMAFHELGHGMIAEFKLPVTGREEDSVDRLATWMLTPKVEGGTEMVEALIYTVFGWMSSSVAQSQGEIAWWGQHSTDEQRGYQVGCLLYGAGPRTLKQLADALKLPVERRESCVKESLQNGESWLSLIEPHVRSEEERKSIPPGSVILEYAPTKEFADERQFLMEIELLETVQEMVHTFKFKPGVTLRTEECGETNAFWRAKQRSLTICYELATKYGDMVEPLLDEMRRKAAEQPPQS